MTQSALTNQVKLSSQRSSRSGTKIDTFLIHHQAGTSDDAVIRAMVSGARQVSANYTISNEGRITLVVPEEFRAWTSGSSVDGGKGAAWDRRAITVEIENASAGGTWPISVAAITAAAALLVDLRKRYGISIILGHRDLWLQFRASYATFCPGAEKVAQVTKRATALADGSAVFVPYTGGSSTPSYPTTWNGYKVATIQKLLSAAGFPTDADGLYGPDTKAKVKAFQRARGLVADGDVGPLTWAALNGVKPPKPTAPKVKLTVDGEFGPLTCKALQKALGVTADGEFGPVTKKALQRRVGVRADGVFGPVSVRALQRRLGVIVDGAWGSQTTAALQRRLRAGTF